MADAIDVVLSPADRKRINRGKKRKINIENWKDNTRKRLKNSGKEYLSRNGVLKPGKKQPEQIRVCSPQYCELKGCNMDYQKKINLFQEFYKLTLNEQSFYLSKLIQSCKPKRRSKGRLESNSRRLYTFKYVITDGSSTEYAVCKKTFSDIFGLTNKRLQVIQNKIKMGRLDFKDGRGKHTAMPTRIPENMKEEIRNHIRSFPRQENHYSRKSSSKECLPANLSVSRMYRMFKSLNPDTTVKKYLYRHVFKEFNLRFGLPRSDTCQTCDKLFIKIMAADCEEERKKLTIESELHHRRSEAAYDYLNKDIEISKRNPNYIVLAVDLQQVLFCPTLRHSNVFYQRQLSNYNFAIHNMGQNEVAAHLWDETTAQRGSAEIASCILKYILETFQALGEFEKRELIVWSDRCVGQNNNWRILSLYNYLVQLKFFTSVEQKFLCSGHSFLPCDRDFALIERRKRVSNVYVPEMWKYVIAEARIEKPFKIVEMQSNDFKNFDIFTKYIKKDNKLKVTEIMWSRISSDDPTVINVRKSHNIQQPWSSHKIIKLKKNGDPCSDFRSLMPDNLPPLYTGRLAISAEKYKDLCNMASYLTNEYKEFYLNLLHD